MKGEFARKDLKLEYSYCLEKRSQRLRVNDLRRRWPYLFRVGTKARKGDSWSWGDTIHKTDFHQLTSESWERRSNYVHNWHYWTNKIPYEQNRSRHNPRGTLHGKDTQTSGWQILLMQNRHRADVSKRPITCPSSLPVFCFLRRGQEETNTIEWHYITVDTENYVYAHIE